MDFLSQLKKTTLSLLRQNIASNFSYVYRHFGQRDLRHFFSIILVNIIVCFFHQNNKGFLTNMTPMLGALEG